MSAVSSLASATTPVARSAGGFADLSSAQFIKVLITELSHQDPFEPQDSGALLEQLSSLRNIESQMTLQDKLEQLVKDNAASMNSLQDHLETLLFQNQVVTAGNLIGRDIEGMTDDGKTVTGKVTSVRMSGARIVLALDSGEDVGMERVTRMFTGDGDAVATDVTDTAANEDQT